MKKKISFLFICLMIFALLTGCSTKNESTSNIQGSSDSNGTQVAEEKEDTEDIQEIAINSMGETFVFKDIPERIFTNELNLLEILIELGLEDKVVAFAGGEFDVEDALENNQEIIKNIKCLGDYVSLESVIDSGADFVYINPTSFSDRIAIEDFIDKGIDVYACRSNYVQASTIEDVYEDILNLGRIFRIEKNAEELVVKMRKEQQEMQKNTNPENVKPRILVYDFGDSDVFTAGLGLESSIISMAGGNNIFSDIARPWTKVSWEEIVARDPEIIIIHEYPRKESFEEKKKFLLENEILKDVDAIKNERFIKLPMIYTFTGVQNNKGIKLINQEIKKYANQ